MNSLEGSDLAITQPRDVYVYAVNGDEPFESI